MKYNSYHYIFPPRPKNAINTTELNFWDNGSLIAQPKMNGSNCLIFTNGSQLISMNRHGDRMSNFQINQSESKRLYSGNRGSWMVLNGEYLNKSKQDETKSVFNHKLVIFDILVNNSEYLIGQTFEQRIKLLDELYGTQNSEKIYLHSMTENIYRVKSYNSGFSQLFDQLTTNNDVVEGLVMKRKNSKLEVGNTKDNNTKSQLKCRVATKNYKY